MASSAVMTQISTETSKGISQTAKQQTTTPVSPSGAVEEQRIVVPNVQRPNKPQPLKLEQPVHQDGPEKYIRPGFNFNQPTQPMNSEELLELMNKINNSVKAGQFNSQLAQQIFRLYQQLKMSGDKIEQQHKNELHRVFVSLRQACCRDSGQLGTPCRLKIMELVELRAMGWRPNLAHSQYYLNRSTAVNGESYGGGGGHLVPNTTAGGGNMQSSLAPPQPGMEFDQSVMAAPPISAPPFGSVPVNPFAFAPPPHSHHQAHHQPMPTHHVTHVELPTPIVAQPSVTQTAAPSYYLIPASGAFLPHPGPHMAMIPPASPIAAPAMGFPMPPPTMPQPQPPQPVQGPPPAPPPMQQQQTHYQPISVTPSIMTTSGNMDGQQSSPREAETPWPRGAVVKPSTKFTQPQKVPGKNMFRDEIIIRNADSGKIMGVKGRRVAVVEEISKTIISFQKVAQGAKERTLTITGNSEEAIERAKVLIEETIRRNVSPNRPEGSAEENMTTVVEDSVASENIQDVIGTVGDPTEIQNFIEKAKIDENSNTFLQLTSDLGVIKLSCADPEMLQAAQDALNAYFQRVTPLRRSQGAQGLSTAEKHLRAERRKSMPLFSPDAAPGAGGQKGRRPSPTRGQPCPPEEVLSWRRRETPIQPGIVPSQEENGDQTTRGASDSPQSGTNGQVKVKRTDSTNSRSFHRKNQQLQVIAKSTPNLTAMDEKENEGKESTVMVEAKEPRSQLEMNVLYTRDYLLQCSASPLAQVPPGSASRMSWEMPEIVREVPGKFSGAEYKEKSKSFF